MIVYSDKIYELRRKHHMSRKQLADLVGLTPTAVYKWESGESQPNIDALKKMAEHFGVSLDELCDFTDKVADESDAKVAVMTRAFRQLSAEEQDKLLAVCRAMFGSPFPKMKV